MSTNEQIAEASNPQTSPARLQELAASDSSLWVHIAKNPSAYPALLDWLGSQGGEDVKAAIAERSAAPAVPPAPAAPPVPPVVAAPVPPVAAPATPPTAGYVPTPGGAAGAVPQYGAPAPKKGGSKTGLIIVAVIAALALVGAGVWLLFFKDGGGLMAGGGGSWEDFCKMDPETMYSPEQLLANAPNEIRADLEKIIKLDEMDEINDFSDFGEYFAAISNVTTKMVEHCGEDFDIYGF